MSFVVPDLSQTPRLQHLVHNLQELVSRPRPEADILARGKVLLEQLVGQDDWLPEAFAQPHPEHYQQFLLYADPEDRFSIVSFVWGPGQATPVHDHTVWGLIGMLRGEEVSQPYAQDAQGRWQPSGEAIRLQPGQVEAVSPTVGDVHKVHNASAQTVAISIHVYGANIGKVRRHVYKDDGSVKEFISGYSNALTAPESAFPRMTFLQVREALLAKREIALIDVREEDPFAQAHPLFAVNIPLGQLEAQAWSRIPLRDTCIVVYGQNLAGEDLAENAATLLQRLGYTHVHVLAGGLKGWADSGGELFRDVNVPSKSFGELVESVRHTPSLSAQEVKALIDGQADVVVLDARRFDEYQTMSIPQGVSVPGAELVLRARAMAPKASTRIIVNCAGRTRSIIGTQSLINAGIPNPVSALRNGTIGWTLAGQELVRGASARFPQVDEEVRQRAAQSAFSVAIRAGVLRINLETCQTWLEEPHRTTYLFDVRTPEEFAAGHLPGARSAPGGQLVQETDHQAAVRGARLVLYDTDGVRANMSASWLAQMGWEVYVLQGLLASDLSQTEAPTQPLPEPAVAPASTTVEKVRQWLQDRNSHTVVFDFSPSRAFVQGHLPNAWWMLRTELATCMDNAAKGQRYILTCTDGSLSRYAWADVQARVKPGITVLWLEGGNAAWTAAGHSLQSGEHRLAMARIDRYRRPYEGTDNPVAAMQGYLDWEFGLVEQLRRDGTHGFKVI